jgi:hypothetical protein
VDPADLIRIRKDAVRRTLLGHHFQLDFTHHDRPPPARA